MDTDREHLIRRIEAIQQEIHDLHAASVESSSELWANRAEVHALEDEWRALDEQLADPATPTP